MDLDIRNPIISRRSFLKVAGIVVIELGVGGCAVSPMSLRPETPAPDALASQGYLLVDTRMCQGCLSCMLACSLVHEGRQDLSLARIQVLQDPFEKYPYDIGIGQCRQCLSAACVGACATGALHVDKDHGNVRLVDVAKCVGCQACVKACPYEPSRAIWNFEQRRAQKCDLCTVAPFWKEQGGLGGKQACVTVCPVGAIKFTALMPVQKGDAGYEVNLRDKNWKKLGYPTD